jgi:hypothetical protein
VSGAWPVDAVGVTIVGVGAVVALPKPVGKTDGVVAGGGGATAAGGGVRNVRSGAIVNGTAVDGVGDGTTTGVEVAGGTVTADGSVTAGVVAVGLGNVTPAPAVAEGIVKSIVGAGTGLISVPRGNCGMTGVGGLPPAGTTVPGVAAGNVIGNSTAPVSGEGNVTIGASGDVGTPTADGMVGAGTLVG